MPLWPAFPESGDNLMLTGPLQQEKEQNIEQWQRIESSEGVACADCISVLLGSCQLLG